MILDLLAGVKRTGPHQWVARCPAHEDRSPSLSIRQADDGRILLHCFAGCAVHDVLGALGLDMGALFPEPLYHRAKPLASRISAADALKCLSREAGVIAIMASDLADGRAVDADRAATAAGRIAEALEVTCG
jgi:hypothetical protein